MTRTSSLGLWVPVHDYEWDGDIPLGLERPEMPRRETSAGEVMFKGDTLPWVTGQYEVLGLNSCSRISLTCDV